MFMPRNKIKLIQNFKRTVCIEFYSNSTADRIIKKYFGLI